MSLPITEPFPLFLDLDGAPLASGALYFGVANENPETSPLTVYWDAELTQPASQPISTTNGLPARSGTPGQLFAAQNYSLTVRDRTGSLVYSALTSTFADAITGSSSLWVSPLTGTDTLVGSVDTVGSYTDGLTVRFLADNTNTAGVTINLNGLGAKTVYKAGTTPLVAGDIIADHVVQLTYDGTNFQVSANTAVYAVSGNNDDILTLDALTTVPTVVAAAIAAANGPIKNYVVNGSFAITQTAVGTTDNSYTVDGWRLLLGAANAATAAQDTTDVPVGAGYALKLTVGSGNNNKFGVFCPIENAEMVDLKSGVCSIRVPLKATAGLTDGTGKIRIGIMQWTGTADAISATPISAWGAEGTNPTLIANWAFANTPAAISVTTSWANYLVENVSISASATNLGILIWSDDRTNTQTTDILRIGGYVSMGAQSTAPGKRVAKYLDELASCQRYVRTTFPKGTTPAQNAGVAGSFAFPVLGTSLLAQSHTHWDLPMFAAPTVTFYNPSAANAQCRDGTVAGDATNTSATQITINGFNLTAQFAGIGATLGDAAQVHYTAIARL